MLAELKVLIFVDLANLVLQAKAAGRRVEPLKLTEYVSDPNKGRRPVGCLSCYLPPRYAGGSFGGMISSCATVGSS